MRSKVKRTADRQVPPSHAALERALYEDACTELPVRAVLLEQLSRRAAGRRDCDAAFAVVAIAVGGLSGVRETFGWSLAEGLLSKVVERLGRLTRQQDMLARLGDDTLALLLGEVRDGREAVAVARRLLAELDGPVEHAGHRGNLWGRAGISLFPADAADAATLLAHADGAMRRAKRGEAQVQLHSQAFADETRARLELERALREAVAEHAFRLHFQPRLSAHDGRVTGAEALLRWDHPELGPISPGRFVPVLESSGLIVDVGGWVIEQAAQALARWRRVGRSGLRLSVNVSALQFRRSDVAGLVRNALLAAGEDPGGGRLELEITESLLLGDSLRDAESLHRLHDDGVPLAIDDFGTGYSSLSYLVSKPLDVVKIDRSFINRLGADGNVDKVVQAIIAMSHALGMKVVAEGVETRQQHTRLVALDCDEVQGYLTGRPVPEPDFLAALPASAVA